MNSYDKSSINYLDYKGRFLEEARKALIDKNNYQKEDYDVYFINDEPTEELWTLYEDTNFIYLEDKIKFLEQLP